MAEGRFSLKDHLFNERKVAYLADLLTTAIPGFARTEFEEAVMADLAGLELKARVDHIANVLESHLDDSFEVAAMQIELALPQPLNPTKTVPSWDIALGWGKPMSLAHVLSRG